MGEEQARPVGTVEEPEHRDCTLGELIDLLDEAKDEIPADLLPIVQAIVVYAQRVGDAARTHGNTLVKQATAGIPLGYPAGVG